MLKSWMRVSWARRWDRFREMDLLRPDTGPKNRKLLYAAISVELVSRRRQAYKLKVAEASRTVA